MAVALANPYYEIWVAELKPDVSTIEALGPGRTLSDHYQYLMRRYTRAIGIDPLDAENYFRRARCYVYLQEDKKAFAPARPGWIPARSKGIGANKESQKITKKVQNSNKRVTFDRHNCS